MNIRTYIAPALIAGATLLSSSAQAATVTDTLNVQLVIAGTCTVNAGGLLDFGITGSTNNALIYATEDFTVNCTNGLPYTIELDAGASINATAAVREMLNGTEAVKYSLRHTSNTGPLWGDGTNGTTAAPGNGTGGDVTHTVYGEVLIQPSPSNGTYIDSVVVTVVW